MRIERVVINSLKIKILQLTKGQCSISVEDSIDDLLLKVFSREELQYINEYMDKKRVINTEPLIYLASPYYHPDAPIRLHRFRQVCQYAGQLFKEKKFVFSPIMHNHPFASMYRLKLDWDFWKDFDLLMLSKCDSMIVLQLDGWMDSIRVNAEIKEAKKIGMDICMVEFND